MKRLNARKKPQSQSHHNSGLAVTIQSPAPMRTALITVDTARDFPRSAAQRPGVMFEKPCFFSMTKVRYIENGIEKKDSA